MIKVFVFIILFAFSFAHSYAQMGAIRIGLAFSDTIGPYKIGLTNKINNTVVRLIPLSADTSLLIADLPKGEYLLSVEPEQVGISRPLTIDNIVLEKDSTIA